MIPCNVKTNKEARLIKDFRLRYKDEYGDIRIVEAGYSPTVSNYDVDDSSYLYFCIKETTENEGSTVIFLRSQEIEALLKWWQGTK